MASPGKRRFLSPADRWKRRHENALKKLAKAAQIAAATTTPTTS